MTAGASDTLAGRKTPPLCCRAALTSIAAMFRCAWLSIGKRLENFPKTIMSETLRNCAAPAKLNLFLHVTGRRDDGYHMLQTVFQLVDYGDMLHFTSRNDGAVRRLTQIADVPEEADLTVRAARMLQEEIQRRTGKHAPGTDIEIEKRLPLGGGLGGGSSDAATTLIALNHLWGAGLRRDELMALGLRLGADVPFFVFGRNAFAEGVGEVLTPVETPGGWYVVLEPGISVPTAAIFRDEQLTRNSEPVKMSDFSRAVADKGSFGKNDLQFVAERLFPPVADAVKWLSRYAAARMTGSGACVFARFANEEAADEALKDMPLQWKGWKAKAIRVHPLSALLSA